MSNSKYLGAVTNNVSTMKLRQQYIYDILVVVIFMYI
jgi:hypothetical protein